MLDPTIEKIADRAPLDLDLPSKPDAVTGHPGAVQGQTAASDLLYQPVWSLPEIQA